MDNEPHYLMTAHEIGELLGITARRVQQYRDDRLLPAIERGKFDVAFLIYLRIGEKLNPDTRTRPDRDVLVASGWAASVGSNPTADDVEKFVGLFERNSLARDAAMMALGATIFRGK